MKEKLTSRKLWVAIIGIVTGIGLIVTGDTPEGATTLIASILGYLLAEGIIDAKAVDSVLDIVDEVGNRLEELEEPEGEV